MAFVRLRTAAVSTKSSNNNKKTPRFFTDRLKNPQCLNNFTALLSERTAGVMMEQVSSIDQRWEDIKKIYHEVGMQTIGRPSPLDVRKNLAANPRKSFPQDQI